MRASATQEQPALRLRHALAIMQHLRYAEFTAQHNGGQSMYPGPTPLILLTQEVVTAVEALLVTS